MGEFSWLCTELDWPALMTPELVRPTAESEPADVWLSLGDSISSSFSRYWAEVGL